MALINLSRVLNFELKKNLNILTCAKIICIQTASITSKEFRDPNVKKPKPWPYKTRPFNMLWGFVEGTIKRFDENTKLIVVDGNIGAGKSSFAKQLADAFDMVYMPEPTLERYFITRNGYDLRQINDILPPSFKCCDMQTYYQNPHHPNVGKMQMKMYMFRLEQYIDALAHLLNTGQGVVLERSVYGDFVFLETMYKFGYVSKGVRDVYYEVAENTLDELLRPHLIIYLDVSPEVCLHRIKQRNNPVEANSKVLTREYLETIEHFYKHEYLKKMEEHAELLVYDWSNYGEVEVVVDDIERLQFGRYSKYDTKMEDWTKEDDWEWNYFRRLYTIKKDKLLQHAYIFRPRVAELVHPTEETMEMEEILDKIPGEKYTEGYNPSVGDNVWFKFKKEHGYRHMPIWRMEK